MNRTLVLAIALVTCPVIGRAQNETSVEFDPSRSRIEFMLSDVLHTVHGSFKMKSGAIRFDPEDNKITGGIIVDAQSGDSGSHARDNRMHRDILQSQTYPEMSFVPTSVQGGVALQGVSQLEVTGLLTLHGAGHEVTLPLSVHVHGDHVAVTTHFVVPYVEWGLKNPSNFILRVSDKVDISVQAAGKVTLPHAAPSSP